MVFGVYFRNPFEEINIIILKPGIYKNDFLSENVHANSKVIKIEQKIPNWSSKSTEKFTVEIDKVTTWTDSDQIKMTIKNSWRTVLTPKKHFLQNWHTGSFSRYVRKSYRETIISYPLTCTKQILTIFADSSDAPEFLKLPTIPLC